MSGWSKLFSSIITSSVWLEDSDTLRIWIAMLAMANAQDIVEGTIPGFASLCRVDRETMQRAIDKFLSPDPDSRTPDNDGRRISAVPGGWKILNRYKYRNMHQDMVGSRAAYYREYRAKNKPHINNVAQCCAQQQNVAHNTDIDVDIDKRKKHIGMNATYYFENFWNQYPSRNGLKRGKIKALKEWKKLKPAPELIEKIFLSLKNQIENYAECKRNNEFVPEFPDPERWLRDQRWNDEIKTRSWMDRIKEGKL